MLADSMYGTPLTSQLSFDEPILSFKELKSPNEVVGWRGAKHS